MLRNRHVSQTRTFFSPAIRSPNYKRAHPSALRYKSVLFRGYYRSDYMSFNFSEPVRGVKRHTSVFGGSMCAVSVRFHSDGVALWEMLFLVWFEDGE